MLGGVFGMQSQLHGGFNCQVMDRPRLHRLVSSLQVLTHE